MYVIFNEPGMFLGISSNLVVSLQPSTCFDFEIHPNSWNTLNWSLSTCSCPFVQHFPTLFCDDVTIIWNENIFYFFNGEENLLCIFINKLLWYHPKQAAKVSRVDRDISKSSSSHPQVIWSNLIQSDPIWSNLIQSDPI